MNIKCPTRRTAAVAAGAAFAVWVLFVVHAETKFGLSKLVDWGLYEPVPTCTVCDALPGEDGIDLIAHAAGEIDGLTYTNSLEAVVNAFKTGFRFIEVDLRRTLDNQYFGAHRIKEFNEVTGRSERWILPPTTDALRDVAIDGRLTPLLLTDLVPFFAGHPERILVTDKANRYRKLLDEFPLPEQLLVEVGNINEYVAAKLAGILNVAVATHDAELVRRYGIELVVVSPKLSEGELLDLREAGAQILVASYDDCDAVPEETRRLASLVYVDACGEQCEEGRIGSERDSIGSRDF